MNIKIIRSNRKTMSLSVDNELNAVVRTPFFVTKKAVDDFVNANKEWLDKAVQSKEQQLKRYDLSEAEINRLVNLAKEVIPHKVDYYSSLMNLKPTGVKITKAKTRFGSCSPKNSLCFSCFLMTYPDDAVDYVVVHELAHIRYRNHGKEFYNLIEQYHPDYKKRILLLKSI